MVKVEKVATFVLSRHSVIVKELVLVVARCFAIAQHDFDMVLNYPEVLLKFIVGPCYNRIKVTTQPSREYVIPRSAATRNLVE
jgi:hypothetical protein